MNKSFNIVFIIILTVIAVALISIMILAIVNKDYKVSLFSFGDKTKKIFEKEFDVNEIKHTDINVGSANVKFVEGNDDKVKVTIYGTEDEQYKVDVVNDKLTISKENKVFHVFVFMAWVRQEVYIEVPKEYSGDVRYKNIKW